MQLNFFDHGRDTLLRNDMTQAIERRDAASARAAWQMLQQELPEDELLHSAARLIAALEHAATAPFPDHDALRQAREAALQQIEPAARQVLGAPAAAAWMQPLWRQLAQRAARLGFAAACSDDHAAPLWLRGGDARAAADAVAAIPSWRRIPAPLDWAAEASHGCHGLDATWPLLAELAWLSPQRFQALAQRLADPALDKLRRRFDACFEGDGSVADLAWFPAWVLTEKSSLCHLLEGTQAGTLSDPETGMRLLLELLRLEHQGRQHEMLDRRKALRQLNESLYAAYMAPR